ncbi:MAG: metal-dependent hydrolase [Gammaproteobacteria bacterium]|nr:metal-dependent hydrolase [Gammaproteobacteria bacterium]
MDPISQGIVGTTAAQQFPKLAQNKRQLIALSLLGFLSGMAPDIDVVIRSSEDPMLFLEYHRQFTHSFLFIPFGGLLCALLGQWLLGKRAGLSFKATYIACTVGYATHGLLDACTSYGTLLLWPFSDMRIAWHNLPIVDPLLTFPLITFCVARIKTGKTVWSRIALIWLLAFPAIGIMQRSHATAVATELAGQRGHVIERLEVRPGFGNLFVWKSIYQTTVNGESTYFVDAIHVSTKEKVYQGTSIPVLNLQRDFPWLDQRSQQAKDVERFRWFSDNYLSVDPANPNRIVDKRYSMMPHEIKPFWGVELSPSRSADGYIDYTVTREVEEGAFGVLWKMIRGMGL